MWRAQTNADRAKEKQKAQEQYRKKLGWNPGYKVDYSKKSRSSDVSREETWQERELREERAREQKKAEERDYAQKIESVQEDEDAFTPAGLYEAGLVARAAGDGEIATGRFWQALICGESRAAFPLFEMLRDGEGGLVPNLEMAGLILIVGRKCNDQKCIDTQNLENMPLHAAREVFSVYAKSRDLITDHGKKITDEIMAERQAEANAALDQFQFITRVPEEAMIDVFNHTAEEDAQLKLAGEVEQKEGHEDSGSKKCIVM